MKEIPQEFLAELQETLNKIAILGALYADVKLYASQPPDLGLARLAWVFYQGSVRHARKAHYTSDPLSWILAASALLGDLASVVVPMIPADYEFRCLVHQAMMDNILRYTRRQLRKAGPLRI